MDAWLFWIVVACALGAVEALTMGLFLAPFALGAAIAALLASLGAGLEPTLASFAATSLLVLFALRPLVVSQRRVPAGSPRGRSDSQRHRDPRRDRLGQ